MIPHLLADYTEEDFERQLNAFIDHSRDMDFSLCGR